MIKSTHPELEKMIKGIPVEPDPELSGFLDGIGLPYARHGTGLILDTDIEFLDEQIILGELDKFVPIQHRAALDLEIHRVADSTNNIVMQRLSDTPATAILCAAEMQTAGKGRRGRQWVSPFGRNIYLTYGCFVDRQLSELGGLSLITGMVVVDVLRKMGVTGAGLKWPNDILLEGGKLGGILIELKPAEARGIGIVAGVGLNLSLNAAESASIDQPWRTVDPNARLSRNDLLGATAASLVNVLQAFNENGFGSFASQWDDYNLYAGQQVKVVRGNETVVGIDGGVDEQGNLLLRTASGVEIHNSGEVSLRPVVNS